MSREAITDRYLFDVFPEAQTASGLTDRLRASLEHVLATGEPHTPGIQRYDLPGDANADTALERYWSITNTPVLNAQGNVWYIIHETVNVTASVLAERQLRESQQREQHIQSRTDALQLAQAEALYQKERLYSLLMQAPVGIGIFQGEGHIVELVNPMLGDLLGRDPEQLLHKSIFDVLPEVKQQGFGEILDAVLQEGKPFEQKELPVTLIRQGELEQRHFHIRYQALRDTRQQITGVMQIVYDVTEQVRARQMAEQSEAMLQLALEAGNMATFNFDVVQQQVARSANHDRLLGYEQNQLNWNIASLLLHTVEEDHAIVKEKFSQAMQTGLLDMEVRIRRVDGELRWMRNQGQVFYEQAQPVRIAGVMLDVTRQKAAEAALREQEQQLRLLTDALPVLISYIGTDERYYFANKAYEQWFHLNPENMLALYLKDVVGEETYRNIKPYFNQAMAGERMEFEVQMDNRHGHSRHVLTNYIPHVVQGKVEGVYVLITDMTEQKNARQHLQALTEELAQINNELAAANAEITASNRELAEINKQLSHTNVDLDNFIYTASHDLKAPIFNIEGLLQALQSELPAESLQQEVVQHIMRMMQDSIERFKRTIANLTEVTKLQKDNSKEVSLVQLPAVVGEVKLDLQQMIRESGAQVVVQMQECPAISFSEKNLRSIVYNLLSNAIKYRAPGRAPLVQLRCHQEPGYIVLTVQDNGLGMNAGQQQQLFTMFKRFHDHVEGSGIGLYMVKRIIENAGGKIEVASRVGEGTAFYVYFRH